MHIAVIPDGNRRYMRSHGLDLAESYIRGIRKFKDFLQWCSELGVGEVTAYALSIENLVGRPPEEVDTLLKLFTDYALDDEVLDCNARVVFCGDDNVLWAYGSGERLLRALRALEEKTRGNVLRVNLALAYGGRQEILHAVYCVREDGLDLTEENLSSRLWVQREPDLVIRTSETRLSNFLLWQTAYSEIFFLNKLWQEIEKQDLVRILEDYKKRERRRFRRGLEIQGLK